MEVFFWQFESNFTSAAPVCWTLLAKVSDWSQVFVLQPRSAASLPCFLCGKSVRNKRRQALVCSGLFMWGLAAASFPSLSSGPDLKNVGDVSQYCLRQNTQSILWISNVLLGTLTYPSIYPSIHPPTLYTDPPQVIMVRVTIFQWLFQFQSVLYFQYII